MAIPALQQPNLFGNFLAAKQAASDQQAESQQNSLRALQLTRAQNLNALAANPSTTPEQYIRAGDPTTGNALLANQQQTTQQKQEALTQISGLAQRALAITDPVQRKQFLQQATPAYSSAFSAIGADHTQGLDLSNLPDDQLEQRLKQVAQFAPPQKPVEVQAGASLVNPNTGTSVYTAPAKPQEVAPGGTLVNPATGKPIYQSPPAVDNKPIAVVGPDGKPRYVRGSDAIGKAPWSPTMAAAGSVTDEAKELAYQTYKTTGQMPATGRGGAAMQAAYMNYIAKRADQDGDTATSMAARGQAFKAGQAVIKDFTSGQTSKVLNGINTSVAHMDMLDPLIDNLNNTQSPAWNKFANAFKYQTGSNAPTNFAAMKEFVQGEVAKAVLPGGGGETERAALAAPLSAANTPEDLKSAVQIIKGALAGKTEALRNQWDVGTNGSQGSFDKFLVPATRKALGGATPAATSSGSNVPTATGPNGQKLYLRNGQWSQQ